MSHIVNIGKESSWFHPVMCVGGYSCDKWIVLATLWMRLYDANKKKKNYLFLPFFSKLNTMPPAPLIAVPSKVSRETREHLNFR